MFADKVMKAALKHIEIIVKAQDKGTNGEQVSGGRCRDDDAASCLVKRWFTRV